MANGMICVSSSLNSPISASASAPAALKYRRLTLLVLYAV